MYNGRKKLVTFLIILYTLIFFYNTIHKIRDVNLKNIYRIEIYM